MRKLVLGLIALGALIVVAAPNFADDKKPGDQGGGMDADAMKKMMDECMKLAAPGEHHRHLEPMAGSWSAVGKFHMDPSAPWEEHKSEATSEWILGGRFLNQKVKGEPMMGLPTAFEGFGLMGYDNGSKKYVSAWCDSMGTMLMMAEGTCDSTGKTITMMSKFMDPMMKKESWMKLVYKIESPDKYTMSMSGPDMGGKEFMCMEIVYTKKK